MHVVVAVGIVARRLVRRRWRRCRRWRRHRRRLGGLHDLLFLDRVRRSCGGMRQLDRRWDRGRRCRCVRRRGLGDLRLLASILRAWRRSLRWSWSWSLALGRRLRRRPAFEYRGCALDLLLALLLGLLKTGDHPGLLLVRDL